MTKLLQVDNLVAPKKQQSNCDLIQIERDSHDSDAHIAEIGPKTVVHQLTHFTAFLAFS